MTEHARPELAWLRSAGPPETVARATKLSVEQIRQVLAPAQCARTGIPTSVCTCIGPHEVAA